MSCLDDIEILHNGEEITVLTVTKIALWNSGNKHIDLSDNMLSCPLHICTTDGSRILTSKIISDVNSLAVFEVDPNHATDFSIPISFEVIDPKQGAVIQILHTGNADSLVVDGKIKGGQCRQIKQNKYFLIMKTTGMTTLPYFLGPSLLLSLPIIHATHATNSAYIAILFILLLGVCMSIWCTVLFFECWYSMRVPRKLKAYFKH